MSNGDVAVASPDDVLNRKSSIVTPSRKLIISNITLGDEQESPVSNTDDAVLRNRQPSTSGSGTSTHKQNRRRSKSGSNGVANGTAAAPTLVLPEGDGNSTG